MKRLLLVLILLFLTACGGAAPTPTAAPTATVPPTATPLPAPWTIGVPKAEFVALPRPEVGAGNVWLLLRVTVANNTTKRESIKEGAFRLAVDGQPLAVDKAAINAAEIQTKEKGFGDTLGAPIDAKASETRIMVFKVPQGAKSFVLALKTDDKATADLAAPLDISAQVAGAPALPTPVPTATATPRPPTSTPTPRPPTAVPTEVPPTAVPQPPTAAPVVEATPVPPQQQPAPVAPGSGVTITNVTGAEPGGVASVTAQTTPGASCTIRYTTPAQTSSEAEGLGTKTANAAGVVSWSWRISPGTRPGQGSVTVVCGSGRASSAITIR